MGTPLIIVGNWKMNKTISMAVNFIETLVPQIKQGGPRVFIAPPFTAIDAASRAAKGSDLVIGAQNMSSAEEGAFTGEISAKMLKDAGAQFSLIGHSERRQLFGEDDAAIHDKLRRALLDGIMPILCVGETDEERKAGLSEKRIISQLEAALKGLNAEEINRLMIAYEPTWAIGTNMAATPEFAEEVHGLICAYLEKSWGKEVGSHIPLLYGGSVKLSNIQLLIEKSNIDGVLIGGASLDAETFIQMIQIGDQQQ